VQDVIDRLPQVGAHAAYAKPAIRDALIDHRHYIAEHGEDHPNIVGWRWGSLNASAASRSSTEADNI
jgi:xylulose-5-phosphate/fructose-6-phosphate phosphoketolase